MENKVSVQIHHLHVKRFHMVTRLRKSVQYITISGDIRRNPPVFLAVSYLTFTNELCQLWSYWTEFRKIFTRYTGIICAVNGHIEVVISNLVLNARTTNVGSLLFFFTKSVAMATSPEISENEVKIYHLYPKRSHLV